MSNCSPYWNWYSCNDPHDVTCPAFQNGTCGEYGVDVYYNHAGAAIRAPESGTVSSCYLPSSLACWNPGYVQIVPDAGSPYPGTIRIGHVVPMVTSGHVSAGEVIATEGTPTPGVASWSPHIEFMYSPTGATGNQGDFTGGCNAPADPCGEVPSNPNSPWSVLVALEAGSPAPSLSYIKPNSASPGSVVTIIGSNLNGASSVLFNGVNAHVLGDTAGSVTAVVPYNAPTRDGAATVTTSGGTGSIPFHVEPLISFRGDFAGNGRTDSVYVYPSGDIVWTFLSNGDGSYMAKSYSLGSGFDAAGGYWMTGDINGDGKADLIYVYPAGDIVWTFLSNGDGSYTAKTYSLGTGFDAGGGVWTTGDINGDGRTDLVYIYARGNIAWTFLSNGDGSYTPKTYSLGSGFDAGGGYWMTGDANGDGKADLIYVYPSGDIVWTFLSNGNGSYTAKTYSLGSGFDAGGGIWEPADVNGDGKSDLVYVYPGGDIVWTFLSNGDGSYTPKTYSLGSGFDAGGGYWMTGDANGDGKADLIYVYPSGDIVWTYLSNGDGSYSAKTYSLGTGFDAGGGYWSVSDANGDGKSDLTYVYPPGNIVWTFLSNGDGSYTARGYGLASGFDPGGGTWLSDAYLPHDPSGPLSPSALAGEGAATVRWKAPPAIAPISAYNVTPIANGVVQATQTFVSAATTETISGLADGTHYTFAIAGINAGGIGPSTSTNAITVGTALAPTAVTATGGTAQASVSWTAPASNGTAPLSGYVVSVYSAGKLQFSRSFNSTATTEPVTGLVSGTTYTFRVAAKNGVGIGAKSKASNSVLVS